MIKDAEAFKEVIDKYKRLEMIVGDIVDDVVRKSKIASIHVEHRIKTVESIRGKLVRKPDKYPSIYSIRDILGFRIICYYSDQVDEIASMLDDAFEVDAERSSDKRKLIDPTVFGYLSLHYICSLPEDKGYAEDLLGLQFEIQIRSMLQHTWAEIEHDMGYKTEFGIPRNIRRDFSRVAGLLETADDIFVSIKRKINEYQQQVRFNIENDCADDMLLDIVTLREFARTSNAYGKLNEEIASITNAHVAEANPDSYLKQLDFLGIKTLGDMVKLIAEEHDLAYDLAEERLKYSELDEFTSTIGLYYLCRAKLIDSEMSEDKLREFFELTSHDKLRAANLAKQILYKRNN